MGDRKAKFFSGDEFYTLCMEDEQMWEQEEAAVKQRKIQRDSHATMLAAWKRDCDAIQR